MRLICGDADRLTTQKNVVMNLQIMTLRTLCRVTFVSAASALILFSHSASAQENNIQTLPEMVVTASRLSQAQTEAIPNVTVITEADIQQYNANDVLGILSAQAGINVVQSGGGGQATSIFMRGTNANQHLILIDGVPIQDPTSIGSAAYLEHISPEMIERIEIVRGNVSAIYGSRAIGGVIQIFTKKGEGKPRAFASAEMGSQGTRKANAGLSGSANNQQTRYMISASKFKTDGFSAMDASQNANVNPDKDRSENASVSVNVSHEWQAGHELGARLYFSDAEFDYDDGGSWAAASNTHSGEVKQEIIGLYSKNRLSSNWHSKLAISSTEVDRAYNSAGIEYGYESQTNILQWNNEVMLSPVWMMTAGIDLADEKAQSYSSRTNQSVYLGLVGDIDKHHFQWNVRHDHVGDSGSDTTGYLGYGYDLNGQWKLLASASTAFLAPSLYQLYDPYVGNPDLNAEQATSYELGVQYTKGATLARMTLFSSRVRDQIDYVYLGGLTGEYINIARAKNIGLELAAQTTVDNTDLKASLMIQNPENADTGEALLRRPTTQASFSATKSIGKWRFGGDVEYVGDRRDSSSVELPAYWLCHLHARYQLAKDVAVRTRIENVFDRDYQTSYGYNQAPFGIFVGLHWQP